MHLPRCQLAYKVKDSWRFLDASHIIGFKSDLEAAVHVLPLKKTKQHKRVNVVISSQTSLPGLIILQDLYTNIMLKE